MLNAGLKLQVKLGAADALLSAISEVSEFHQGIMSYLKKRA